MARVHVDANAPQQVGALDVLTQRLQEVCTLRAGVPSQPMLARPCTSIADAIKLLLGGGASATIAAEHKYDGQRAQVHRAADGSVRLFSRKLDDMTSKVHTPPCVPHDR